MDRGSGGLKGDALFFEKDGGGLGGLGNFIYFFFVFFVRTGVFYTTIGRCRRINDSTRSIRLLLWGWTWPLIDQVSPWPLDEIPAV